MRTPDDAQDTHRQAHHHSHSSSDHGHASHPLNGGDAAHADLLALDAELLGGYLDEATAWAAEHAARKPRLIVDAGAGTGPGSLALARRFPRAQVVALDRSSVMLDRVEAAAAAHSLADRVATVQADLDEAWPALGVVDVIWASSSLHEAADPNRTLASMNQALAPGGLLLVLEIASLPRFLPAGYGPSGLQDRLDAALDQAGWNHHPDWRPLLERAGFAVVGQRDLTAEADVNAPGAADFADRYLRRMRSSAQSHLPSEDLTALDLLLDPGSPQALLRRADLTISSRRSAWAAISRRGGTERAEGA